jgi:hypothetical protein
MVAQVDEQQPAMVADSMAPARQTGSLVDIAFAECAASMGPVTMHGNPENGGQRAESGGIAGPEERQGLPEAVRRGNRMHRQNRPAK